MTDIASIQLLQSESAAVQSHIHLELEAGTAEEVKALLVKLCILF